MKAAPPSSKTIALPATPGSSSGTPKPALLWWLVRMCWLWWPWPRIPRVLRASASGVGLNIHTLIKTDKPTSKRFMGSSSCHGGKYNGLHS